MNIESVGVLHPGAMGSSIGAAIKAGGRKIYWVSQDRSPATAERAEKAGFDDASRLSEVARCCELIISICPPAFAEGMAEAICNESFTGLYLDANAVGPDTSRRVAGIVESAGACFVDGGIIGPPAWEQGTTRLYLSGTEASTIAEIFKGSLVDAIVIAGPAGKASALKMTYAAFTKGTTALIGAILAVAEREGVRETLRQEWLISQTELANCAEQRVRRATAKAWRFEGEMEEIAASFQTAGLPSGFHRAAAEVYARLANFKDSADLPSLQSVLDALLRD